MQGYIWNRSSAVPYVSYADSRGEYMNNYYAAPETRSHAFLLERRLKDEGVMCEIAFMPRQIMTSLCNMGVRFDESQYFSAIPVLRRCGLPGCKLYKETIFPTHAVYSEELL